MRRPVKRTRPQKTRYCKYHDHCDREEDCWNGESCPVQEPNEAFSVLRFDPVEEADKDEIEW